MLPLGVSAVTLGFGFLITLDKPPFDLRSSIRWSRSRRRWWPCRWSCARWRRCCARSTTGSARLLPRSAPAGAGAAHRRPAGGRRALLAAAGFAFAVSLGEFGATSFLARDDRPTLPVVIYRLIGHPGAENFGMAMAASVVLAVATSVVMLGVQRLRVGSLGAL